MRTRVNKMAIDIALMEAVVRQEVDAVSLRWTEYHRFAERVPAGLHEDDKVNILRALDRKLFSLWGYQDLLLRVWDQYPHLQKKVEFLQVRQADTTYEEGAFIAMDCVEHGIARPRALPSTAPVILAGVRPDRFRDVEGIRRFLHHEFVRASDMLDESFGYGADLPKSSLLPEALIRDRYRVLWDAYIDGRLEQRGLAPLCSREERWKEYSACYPRVSEDEAVRRFDALWAGHGFGHREFLALASQVTPGSSGPAAGSPCPLCRFPTFSWAEIAGGPAEGIADKIQEEFPAWSIGRGACQQCVDLYAPHLSRPENAPHGDCSAN